MRIQRAKRLIDETTVLMTEIAGRAGIASIRSFNASFCEVYRCTPTELRRGGQ
jgi:AraC family transcriptional regulator, regulatory protein of adaptative response / methylated-DNA-[protein]-cysteine methyltransferase